MKFAASTPGECEKNVCVERLHAEGVIYFYITMTFQQNTGIAMSEIRNNLHRLNSRVRLI